MSRNVSSESAQAGPVETSIRQKLNDLFKPTALEISNDSSQHRHHTAMRAQGGGNGETHFSVMIVSEAFEQKRSMQRHRMIYSALADEFNDGLHALSINAKTPAEIVPQGNADMQ
ncbi:bola-like protein [Schizopora paradoxa]|uniref:Bola-like protein n=1 Tax=Schizopora paradoxa TaxID=27342 RepID=A0A0H2RSM3_9AGAM|nr:bola-like protein [Schizopora paradoxa]